MNYPPNIHSGPLLQLGDHSEVFVINFPKGSTEKQYYKETFPQILNLKPLQPMNVVTGCYACPYLCLYLLSQPLPPLHIHLLHFFPLTLLWLSVELSLVCSLCQPPLSLLIYCELWIKFLRNLKILHTFVLSLSSQYPTIWLVRQAKGNPERVLTGCCIIQAPLQTTTSTHACLTPLCVCVCGGV